MGILGRLKERFEGLLPAENSDAGEAAVPEHFTFSAEVPAGSRGPIWSMKVQLLREPQQGGDRLRLRAHMQSNLASVLRPALQRAAQAPPSALQSPSRELAPSRRAAAVQFAERGLQRALSTPLAQRIAAPLLRHDFNTWLELQASTEPLDDGAHGLVPQHERLAAMGVTAKKSVGPVAESWTSQTPGGYAQLSLLQIDKSSLPPELARRLGAQPFQLAAAIASTVERK